jgi:diguanylate cyclase (GGDEF)-like protein
MGATATLRLQQEVADTYRLARIGGWFYLTAWLIVAYYGRAFMHSAPIAWSITFALLVLAVLRGLHKPPTSSINSRGHYAWLMAHWCIVIATTTIFGSVFVWTMIDPRMSAAHEVLLLAVMGLSVAVAHAFSMRLGLAVVGVATLYLPGLIVLWATPIDRASALMMSLYFTYVAVALWRSNADYQHILDVDQQLRDQRDLFEKQGRTDALTELANRRFFTECLMGMSEQALGDDGRLVLLVLDLDHFKSVNDRYGHAAGDACLTLFASRLKAIFGNVGEHAARLGGEEFGVLLQGHSLEVAMLRAEGFRAMCANEPIQVGEFAMPITVSIGVAAFDPQHHQDGDGLYRAADTAVYRAKNSGRNRVCGHEPAC